MTIKLGLKWQRPESPVVIGLLHDVCKVNEYNMIVDESEEKGYRIEWNKKQILTGHGVASVMMIQQYAMKSGDFILTEEEMMCIQLPHGSIHRQVRVGVLRKSNRGVSECTLCTHCQI